MRHIPTTATAVEKLKLEAKRLSQTTDTSLTAARELVAKAAGYNDWKHVTCCATTTRGLKGHQRLERVAQELFEDALLRALLTENLVGLLSSTGGGVFSESASGERVQVDSPERMNEHVVPRLLELLQGLGQHGALLEADVRVNGAEVCLSAFLPPVCDPIAWSIVRRSHVPASARKPVLLDIRLLNWRQ
ncbi:hypothetical protein [Roseateles sp. MS654]|uniref:hypothetical protein n=1 Tax=Roseateles sp. MS654 TaxID=3412685 RepID=UPI003C2DF1B4